MSPFSTTYFEARRRFTEAAKATGGRVHTYPIATGPKDLLAIDVAVIGADEARAIVISSGVHGVEGFFGSAIQLALLERLRESPDSQGIRYVLIHSVNPYGFSQLRRVNEDNVDLNRNFLTGRGRYSGAPRGYARLDAFLNPASPPSRFEPFRMKAWWILWRHGLRDVKEAVAGGQYEYPRGLFFGGHRACTSTRIVQANCESWMGPAPNIVHIDFHSGLGTFAAYKLLLTADTDSDAYSWYADSFGGDCVETMSATGGTAYKATGLFGEWMQEHFSSRDYRFVGAEFGTYDLIRVLGSLRAENRAHHFGSEKSASYQSAKRELLECFCPSNSSWRNQVVESGLDIIDRAKNALRVV